MHIEDTTCAVPGCYAKPLFAGLCNIHCTKGEAVQEAQRVLREKVKEMPDLARSLPAGAVAGIQPNDIVSVSLHERRATDARMSEKYPKYYKPVPDGVKDIDIYMLCKMFRVDDPSGCLHHAIKKILLPGVRTGGKTRRDDIKEARDTLTRWLEINQ